ncbi:MAG: diguanylate cyclase [Candidatus Cloacimonetes bacterium 4572_55]|nr:MAG: diguanylate cyclase [Candidatus Cloacimonetes bacterium 4572_55]
MKICIPTQEDKGINSVAYGHFGSAPCFIIHDTEKNETISVLNDDRTHAHGTCHPIHALGDDSVDVVVVGGIGKRAIQGLNAMGIKVYQSVKGTAQNNVNALKKEKLLELTSQNACGGGHGHGCGD